MRSNHFKGKNHHHHRIISSIWFTQLLLYVCTLSTTTNRYYTVVAVAGGGNKYNKKHDTTVWPDRYSISSMFAIYFTVYVTCMHRGRVDIVLWYILYDPYVSLFLRTAREEQRKHFKLSFFLFPHQLDTST